MPVDRKTLGPIVLLALAIALAYAPALRGGFIWDDDAHIYENPTLLDLAGLQEIWLTPGATMQYYPLTFTVFWAAHRIWGLDPVAYHVLNVALHALAAILLWRVLVRLRVPGAPLGAAIFALHPVNVMSVAWVTEVKNTLSASLALGSTLAYLRFAGIDDREPPPPEGPKPSAWYALSLGLFVLAMLAKTAVGFLPVTLALILWWKRGRIGRLDLVRVLPFCALVAAMGLMTIHVERLHGGDVGTTYAMTFGQRVIVAGRSFWFYLGKLAWPHPLSFLYERWALDARSVLSYLPALAAAGVLAALFAARRRIGKGPFVAVAHFVVAGSTVLIFFVVTYFTRFSFVSDHWQYFGVAGIAALAGAGVARLTAITRIPRHALRAVPAVVLAALWLLTFRRAAAYADVETLWRDTIAKTPGAWMAHNNLGAVLFRRGAVDQAIAEYGEALRQKPDLAEAHRNLGNALTGAGRPDEAVPHLEEALRLQPDSAESRLMLGRAFAAEGKAGEAIAQYQGGLRLRPVYPELENSLALALHRAGNRDEAILHFETALRENPDYADAHVNLGSLLAASGRLDEAAAHFARALELDPGNAGAHANLGHALDRSGRLPEAVEQYEQALRLDPRLAAASNSLGMDLAAMDRWDEAIHRFEEALRVRPDFAEAHNNLGIALVRSQRSAEAIEHFQAALRIKPDFADARANLDRALGTQHSR